MVAEHYTAHVNNVPYPTKLFKLFYAVTVFEIYFIKISLFIYLGCLTFCLLLLLNCFQNDMYCHLWLFVLLMMINVGFVLNLLPFL